jgi:hypothetical protein
VLLNTSADWGKSDPLLLQKTIAFLQRRGADSATLQQLVWDNPISFSVLSASTSLKAASHSTQLLPTKRTVRCAAVSIANKNPEISCY